MKLKKTNAMRILDQNNIEYETDIHEVSKDDVVAYQYYLDNNRDLNSIFKTLVLKGKNTGYIVAMLPLDCEVDLKKLAKESGNKSVEMIAQKDLLKVSGYIRGGCSPIGMKKQYPTFIHEDVILYDKIWFSAGMLGAQFHMNPEDLIDLLKIKVCDFAKEKEQ